MRCVAHIQLEAVVRVNEYRIDLLLSHYLLHEEDDVTVAVDLVVVDDSEVPCTHLYACLRSAYVMSATFLSIANCMSCIFTDAVRFSEE